METTELDKQFFYSNGLEIAVSPYDINLKFFRQGTPQSAVVTDPLKSKALNIQLQKNAELTVAMSPGHAKAMLSALYTSIINYEKSVGPIPLQADAQKIYNDTFAALLK